MPASLRAKPRPVNCGGRESQDNKNLQHEMEHGTCRKTCVCERTTRPHTHTHTHTHRYAHTDTDMHTHTHTRYQVELTPTHTHTLHVTASHSSGGRGFFPDELRCQPSCRGQIYTNILIPPVLHPPTPPPLNTQPLIICLFIVANLEAIPPLMMPTVLNGVSAEAGVGGCGVVGGGACAPKTMPRSLQAGPANINCDDISPRR